MERTVERHWRQSIPTLTVARKIGDLLIDSEYLRYRYAWFLNPTLSLDIYRLFT